MKATAVIALVLSALIPASAQAVVNGSNAAITAFPFQVELWNQVGGDPVNGFFCGGVILDATHVATAAHCVFDSTSGQATPPGRLHVLAGTADLTQPGTDIVAAADSFDPRYSPATNDYDMGVLTLPPPGLAFGSTINSVPPVTLDDPGGLAAAGNSVKVSGWGWNHPLAPGQQPVGNYPTDLQAATLQVSSSSFCSGNYGAAGVTITPRMICAADLVNGRDACFGDSGGPLVAGTSPADYKLVGLVESGIGCADSRYPGIYDRVSNGDVQGFITSQPPQAPQQQSPTTISGTPASGQTVACLPGGWTGTTSFLYEFVKDLGNNNLQLLAGPSTQSTYKVQASDVGAQIFCVAKASGPGGYGFGVSSNVVGTVPIVTPPVVDTTRPTLAIARKSCSTRGRCVVNVQVVDAVPSSGIAGVSVKMRWRTTVKCRSRKSGRCSKTKTKSLKAHSIGGGHFLITVSRLKPQNYTLIMTAVDKAGNKQRRPTYTTLRVKAAKKRRR